MPPVAGAHLQVSILTATSQLIASGTLAVSGASTLGGAVTVGGTLGVTGLATLASLSVTSTAAVGGTLNVGGASTLASLGVTGNATVGGTLGVTGAATFATTLGVTGNASFAAIVLVGTAVVTGAVTGDIVLPNGKSLRGVNAAGTNTVSMITVGSGGQVVVSPGAADIVWGKALVGNGGGATPTFGSIGSPGPITAAQNAWMRVVDNGGVAFWVPAWK